MIEPIFKYLAYVEAYLHQDWAELYSSPDEAIRRFRDEAEQEVLMRVRDELHSLIGYLELMSEADAERYLWTVVGWYYRPAAEGLSVVNWLKKVDEILFESRNGG